ncbi:MAG: hypothetical protein HYU54_02930, partial [Actinobacteria bacterium]|nr:hypothetical protein [Actinomycetota bacterium]
TALRLWGEGDEQGRLELLMKLGWARTMAGDVGGARTAYVEAEAGWRAVGDVRRAGGALATLGRIQWIAGEGERAGETLERAIEMLEPGGPSPELVRAHVWASTQHMLQGRMDQAVALATRGLEIEQGLGLLGARSQLLNNLGVCQVDAGDPAGLDRLREALELAERSGDAEAMGRAFTNVPSTLGTFSRNRECAEVCERGREVMRRLGAPAFEQFIASNEAGALADLGRYEDAEALSRETLEEQRAMKTAPGIVNSGTNLVTVWTRKGRYDEARAVMDDILPLARGLGGAEFLSLTLNLEAELEWARGNVAAARQAMVEAADVVLATPTVWHVIPLLALAARLLPPERVRELLDRVRPAIQDPSWEAVFTEAEAVLEADQARFALAADLYASLELPYQEAGCRLEAGELERAAEIIGKLG